MIRPLAIAGILLISACGSDAETEQVPQEVEQVAVESKATTTTASVPTTSTLPPETTVPEITEAELLAAAETAWDQVTAPIIGLGVISGVALVDGVPHAATSYAEIDELTSVGIWQYRGDWENAGGVENDMFLNIVAIHVDDLTGDGSAEVLVTSCPNACFSSVFRHEGGTWVEAALVARVELQDGRLVGEENTCQPSCAAGNVVPFELVWTGSSFDVVYSTPVTAPQQVTCPTYTEREWAPYSLCDKGRGVWFLQRALIYFGYLDGSMDGYFGPKTDRAVRQLQRAYGVAEDGIADGWWYQEFMETYRSYNE